MNNKIDLLSGRRLYERLLSYVLPYKWVFILGIVGMIFGALSETAFAALLKPIMDDGFVERDAQFISIIPWLILGLFAIRGLAGFLGTYCTRWVGRRVIYDVRRDMFSRLLRLPNVAFDKQSSASLVSKFVYDVEQVSVATTGAVTTLIKDTVTVIGLLAWMFYLSWQLTLVFLLIGPVLAYMVKIMSHRFRKTSRDIQGSIGGIAHVVKEAVQGQRLVKAFGGHVYELKNFRDVNNRNRQQVMKKATVAAFGVPVVEFIAAGALAWIIYLATHPLGGEYISPGDFVSYLAALLLLMGPARRLTKVNEPLQTGLAAGYSIFGLMDDAPERDTGTVRMDKAKGRIEYRKVEFHYGSKERDVLRDISFVAEPGKTIALVGPSGSGKSSVVALLARFYDVEEGEILLDGININDIRLEDLRKQISIVTQETILFDDTIRNNIIYGSTSAPDEERIRRSARAAHVDEFADKLPSGLDTVVGEHGVRLSGGQRQRVAIARALYKNASILLLDEATSSLDSASERSVKDAIDQLIRHQTTLVIAHRLSTVEHADQILVLDNGCIVESGTHSELLGKNRHYAHLYRTQFADADHG